MSQVTYLKMYHQQAVCKYIQSCASKNRELKTPTQDSEVSLMRCWEKSKQHCFRVSEGIPYFTPYCMYRTIHSTQDNTLQRATHWPPIPGNDWFVWGTFPSLLSSLRQPCPCSLFCIIHPRGIVAHPPLPWWQQTMSAGGVEPLDLVRRTLLIAYDDRSNASGFYSAVDMWRERQMLSPFSSISSRCQGTTTALAYAEKTHCKKQLMFL